MTLIDLYAIVCGVTRTVGAMHVAKISRRHGDREYDSYLVRRSIREGRRVRHETIANVSRLPLEAIEALTLALKGVALVPAGEAFEIVRAQARPCGGRADRGPAAGRGAPARSRALA